MPRRIREAHYPARVHTSLPADAGWRIAEAAERYGASTAMIVREAVLKGLRPALDARRKAAKRAAK